MQSTGSWCATVSDIQACAEIVQKADPDRFAAVMATPVEVREKLFPLHAFAVEVSRAPWVTQEPMIAEMRLQWWRDALAEIAEERTVRRHEVVTPLSQTISPDTAKLLDGFVEVRRWDIYRSPFEDDAHFKDYLTQTGSSFYMALCDAVSADHAAAAQFGFATAIANWLKAVPELERRGRVPLLDGRPDAIKDLALKGLNSLASARAQSSDRMSRYAFLAGWQTKAILKQASANPRHVASGSLAQSDFSKKASLIWKAATGRF